ncbi:MAG: FprA family A-type flavoprotein [Candidatus Scalinduaceae bacterium]
MNHISIKDNIYWVGVLDPDMRIFDITLRTDRGTTYNSYLIKDEKTVLIDTVKEPFTDDFITNITSLVDPKDIAYIVANHTEPDHSGVLFELLKLAINAKVIASKSGGHLLKNIINKPFDLITIEEYGCINLGTCELKFVSAPYLHWPDTIFTYLEKEKILFTCDAFGSHFCDKRMFDDLVGDFDCYFQYYYDNIMRPFKPYILKAIEKIKGMNIDIIATGHGPILRKDPWKYVESYFNWSKILIDAKKNVLILYVSIYGNTKKMAEAIAEGVSEENACVTLFDINASDYKLVRDAIEKADGILIGSPTIVGDAPKPVWDVLSLLATVKSRIRLGSTFGSYGWSGEATKMIEDRLNGLHIKLYETALKIKLIPDNASLRECHEFGKQFAIAMEQRSGSLTH